MSDTAEYWFNKKSYLFGNTFRHADNINCGHKHNTKETIYIHDIECHACLKIVQELKLKDL